MQGMRGALACAPRKRMARPPPEAQRMHPLWLTFRSSELEARYAHWHSAYHCWVRFLGCAWHGSRCGLHPMRCIVHRACAHQCWVWAHEAPCTALQLASTCVCRGVGQGCADVIEARAPAHEAACLVRSSTGWARQ